MKNIHVLPTDGKKASYLAFDRNKKLRFSEWSHPYASVGGWVALHIYITNSEEIKEEKLRWIIDNRPNMNGFIHQVSVFLDSKICPEIILTTDQDLIKDGVQAIDDEFLEWFVKNPSCEEVEVVYEPKNFLDPTQGWEYTIISKIPKEDWLLNNPQCKQIESCSKSLSKKCICPKEEHKQETLEEAIKQELEDYFFSNISEIKKAEYFISFGAKWQQEQDKNKYSEDDVRGMLEDMSRYVSTKEMRDDVVGVGYSEWVRKRDWFVNHLIEQFKNK
jgi:hypothetical protein